MAESHKKSYREVLKSSALIGASSIINIALGIVRTKVMAVLLGPAGIGLVGLYGSITDLVRTLAGLGISSSGVRQIAEAAGTGDARRVACTVTTLRRVALCSGALGALLLLVFSKPVSQLTFGDQNHAGLIALLALTVFFGDISAAQSALVQGMRRVGDLARISVFGALYGTVFSLPIVYFYGEPGLVPALVSVAAMAIITSWWYARKIQVEQVRMTLKEILRESSGLLKLGLAFMSSGLMVMGSAYLIRILILRRMGVDAAGFYQAAWVLSGLYVGFILQAMGADFYPRLTAVAKDNMECNRLVNEQAEVGSLLAVPGILATLAFAPIVIRLFYSTKFGPAVEILRWISLGMLFRVASWPMGFIVLAKGEQTIFFWAELLANTLTVGLVWASIVLFGLNGTGIGFFAAYFIYWFALLMIVHRLSGFRWSGPNRRLAVVFVPLVTAVFVSWYVLPPIASITLGAVCASAAGIYSLRILCTFIPAARLPRSLQKLLKAVRLLPSVELPSAGLEQDLPPSSAPQ